MITPARKADNDVMKAVPKNEWDTLLHKRKQKKMILIQDKTRVSGINYIVLTIPNSTFNV